MKYAVGRAVKLKQYFVDGLKEARKKEAAVLVSSCLSTIVALKLFLRFHTAVDDVSIKHHD